MNDKTEQATSSSTATTIDHKIANGDEIVDEEVIRSLSLSVTPKRGRGRPKKSVKMQVLSGPEEGMTQTLQKSNYCSCR